MLKIIDCKVSLSGQLILRGLNLEVADGECVAVIGESGAGKTTLGLSVMGLLNGNASGAIIVNGTDILSLSEAEMRRIRWNRIAMSFQSAQNRLNPSHHVIDQVAEPLIAHQILNKAAARDTAAELLAEIGLPAAKLRSFPHELSGGEQQRVLTAMALINNPELLILDEPLSSLDAQSRMDMMAFLQKNIKAVQLLVVTQYLSLPQILVFATRLLQR